MLAERSGVGPGGVLRHPPRGALCFVPEKKCRKKLLILADMSNRMRKHAGKIAKNDFLVVIPPPSESVVVWRNSIDMMAE